MTHPQPTTEIDEQELLPDLARGPHRGGRVFDRTVDLDRVPDGYRAMADHESIKVMVTLERRRIA